MTHINIHVITPCSNYLDNATLEADSPLKKKSIQALQYFARPIDNVIKEIAFFIFETLAHLKDIYDDFQKDKPTLGVVKLLLTPATLSLSLLVNGTLLTIRVALETAFDAFIPVRTFMDIANPDERANARLKSKPDDLLWFKWNVIDIRIQKNNEVSHFKLRFVM